MGEGGVERGAGGGQAFGGGVLQPGVLAGVGAGEVQQHLPGVGGQVQPQIFQCPFGGVLACQRAELSAQVFGVADNGGMGWVGEQVTEPSVGAGLVALHVDWAHAELAGGHGDGLWVQSPSARREHFVVVVGESIEQSADRCRGVHAFFGRGGAGQGHGLARRDHDGAHRTDPAFGPVDQRRDGLAGQIRPGGKLPAVKVRARPGSQP